MKQPHFIFSQPPVYFLTLAFIKRTPVKYFLLPEKYFLASAVYFLALANYFLALAEAKLPAAIIIMQKQNPSSGEPKEGF